MGRAGAAEQVRHGQAAGRGHAGYRTAVPPTAAQAIGVFDSGVGGLTVLDECLATLPAEDFVYFGDTAFFPYGEKTVEELRRRALAIARWLDAQGVKLIVVACNTATAVGAPLAPAGGGDAR